MLNLAILASGRGSNMVSLVEAVKKKDLPVKIVAVVTNKTGAPCLDKAEDLGLPSYCLLPKDYNSRLEYDRALAGFLLEKGVDTICLAGFMWLLGAEFVSGFRGRILNIHPSLLPAFPGLEAQKQALSYGVKISGCTVHFVDEGLDSGPIILQETVPVLTSDTVESLSERILIKEHEIYPRALGLLALGKLKVFGRQVEIMK